MKFEKMFIVALGISILGTSVHAQSTGTKTIEAVNNVSKTANDVNAGGNAVSSTATSTVNSAKSIVDAKNTLSSLFKSKKSPNQIIIAIAGIEFEDENLAVLKDGLGKAKGVKSASAAYKGGTATIEVSYKGKPSELWQDVAKEAKKTFKLIEMGDDNIILQYKSANTVSEPSPEKSPVQAKQ